METKKIYMVPETAFEQFLKPFGILMESDPSSPGGGGSGHIGGGNGTGGPHAPERKPF